MSLVDSTIQFRMKLRVRIVDPSGPMINYKLYLIQTLIQRKSTQKKHTAVRTKASVLTDIGSKHLKNLTPSAFGPENHILLIATDMAACLYMPLRSLGTYLILYSYFLIYK